MIEPWRDPNSEGYDLKYQTNKPCYGCGKKPSGSWWGQWCFDCNVARFIRINAGFDAINKRFEDMKGDPTR